jgi:AraC-like DNA-binding protein
MGSDRAAHNDQVYAVAAGETPPADAAGVAPSWQRSANDYGVDPAATVAPRILTAKELKDARGPLEPLIASARGELDGLYKLVGPAGYTVLLTDDKGIAVECRADHAQADAFKYWGISLGGVWTESVEGTNGIGTAIAEVRPVTIHTTEHFRARHIGLSCSGAPIFDPNGKLISVLDVSAYNPALSAGAHALTGALTVAAARAVEERFFREQFRRYWIVALALPGESGFGALLAVDDGRMVLGANRCARDRLRLRDDALAAGLSLWSIAQRDARLFRRGDGGDVPTRIMLVASGEECPALVTPPELRFGAYDNAFHARPRSDLLSTVRDLVIEAPQARGGLPNATLRRVKDYVEAHLAEPIELATLADVAGVSLFHFARAFKQSTGMTPHHYLVQKRVERAQSLLSQSDRTLSEIALTTGFADQSHLTRRFRQVVGITPSEFRRSH